MIPAMPASTRRPIVLAILDGWGHSEAEDKTHNTFFKAHTPHLNALSQRFHHSLLDASEHSVGLPEGQMGNSEVGHMNIGAGRVVMQDLPRIDKASEDGSLAVHPAMLSLVANLRESGKACHIVGLLSPGGVHAHQDHIAALARIVSEHGVRVYVHAFLDGRDTPPKSALAYLAQFEKSVAGHAGVRMATIGGRYFGMDRDKRWDRVSRAYGAIASAEGKQAASAKAAIEAGYAAGETDEFISPSIIDNYAGMEDGDAVICANFRADRARQFLAALLDPAFDGFVRKRIVNFSHAVGMVDYSDQLNPFLTTLFPPEALNDILGEVVANAGRKQLRIAETEKYAHVTFFFNGGREAMFEGEERILVPSPNVATYDLQPEMSAPEVTDKLVAAIESGRFDLIVVNYANADMVGHSGDMAAAIKAVETVDACVGRVQQAVEKASGALLLTADHGNIEQMFDEQTNQPHTAHTLNRVPFAIYAAGYEKPFQPKDGKLADLAPTVLQLMGLAQPAAMTGRSLL